MSVCFHLVYSGLSEYLPCLRYHVTVNIRVLVSYDTFLVCEVSLYLCLCVVICRQRFFFSNHGSAFSFISNNYEGRLKKCSIV